MNVEYETSLVPANAGKGKLVLSLRDPLSLRNPYIRVYQYIILCIGLKQDILYTRRTEKLFNKQTLEKARNVRGNENLQNKAKLEVNQ